MAIRMRGEKFFVDVTRKGDRRTATCATREEAVKREAALLVAITGGRTPELPSSRRWTLRHAFQRTMDVAWRGSKGERTVTAYAKQALCFFGEHRGLRTITTEQMDAYVKSLQERGNKDNTINKKLYALSKMLRVAHQRGRLKSMPRIPRRREPSWKVQTISDAEEALLDGTLRLKGYEETADFVAVLFDTGARLGEVLRLGTGGTVYDARDGTLAIWESKAGEPRVIPCTSRVRQILQRHHQWSLTEHKVRSHWDEVRQMMGLAGDRRFVRHTARHTCATRLMREGVPVRVVQQWLGHKTLLMTFRYMQVVLNDLELARDALERRGKKRTTKGTQGPGWNTPPTPSS